MTILDSIFSPIFVRDRTVLSFQHLPSSALFRLEIPMHQIDFDDHQESVYSERTQGNESSWKEKKKTKGNMNMEAEGNLEKGRLAML